MTWRSDADQTAAELRGAIEALGAPRAPRGLIGRVAAERARGLRAAIRGGEPTSPPVVRRAVLWGAAALLVVGLVGIDRWPSVEERAAEDSFLGACGMNADARSWLTAGSFLLGAACAQEPAETPFEPAPPVAALDVGALRAGTWVYEVRRQGGRGATKEVYDLAPVGSGESREWRSASTRGTAADKWVLADTVYYAAQELRPVRRVIRILRDGVDWRIHEFSYHSTDVEVVSDYFDYRDGSPQRRPWWAGTLALPAGADPIVPAAHDAGLVHLMRLLPLRAGWAGSVHVGPFGPSGFQPSSFRVAGDETVRVPAGVFDCWRVTIGASGGRTLWISKADHLLVRSLDGPEGRGLERVLSSFTPGG